MWRLANYIYRAFRNVATHRGSQDIIVPLTSVCNKDDESESNEKPTSAIPSPSDIDQIIKNNQFTVPDFEKLQEYIQKLSFQQFPPKSKIIKPIEPPKLECIVQEIQSSTTTNEDTLDSLLRADQACANTLKSLSELHEQTMSIIANQLAIDAIETGDVRLGIETLQTSVKDNPNATALYNLGVCYERGVGVPNDRAKACDYYRQASMLGHTSAQFNLTFLSNRIDISETEEEPTVINSFHYETLTSWNDHQSSLTKTLVCLS